MFNYALYRFSVEPLESRWLKSVTTVSATDNEISNISFDYVGQVQVGDNGYQGGIPGAAIAVNGTETNSTPVLWGDMSNGFDSGWQNVQFSVNANSSGTANLNLANADSAISSPVSSGTLSTVEIDAAVDAYGMSMQWQNIEIQFYSGNTLVDSTQISSIGVDTTNADTNDPQEAITEASTNASNVTSIVVTGQVRMTADQGVYPVDTDIFGQIGIS